MNLNDFEQHQVYLSRLETTGLRTFIYPSLEQTLLAIRRILGEYDTLPSPDTLMGRINQIIDQNNGFTTLTAQQLLPLAIFEADFMGDFYLAQLELEQINRPAAAQITSFVTQAIMTWEGQRNPTGTWAQFVERYYANQKQVVNSIVQRGYLRGQTIAQVIREMTTNFNGLLRQQATTLTRTGYAHYAEQANIAMIDANKDILAEYYYSVTFDSRTSDICMGVTRFNQVGKRFKVGDPKAPIPPLHPNCRTRLLGVPPGVTPSGTKATTGATGGKPIKGGTTYNAWLSRQPAWFINETLGPTRAKLFRQGGLSVDKFTDMSLRPLTLEQIRDKYPRNWDRAFGDN